MMGDTTITKETREKVQRLCAEAGTQEPKLLTEQEAERFLEELQKRMKQRAPDTA
jgi:hypothetical protein